MMVNCLLIALWCRYQALVYTWCTVWTIHVMQTSSVSVYSDVWTIHDATRQVYAHPWGPVACFECSRVKLALGNCRVHNCRFGLLLYCALQCVSNSKLELLFYCLLCVTVWLLNLVVSGTLLSLVAMQYVTQSSVNSKFAIVAFWCNVMIDVQLFVVISDNCYMSGRMIVMWIFLVRSAVHFHFVLIVIWMLLENKCFILIILCET